MKHLLKTAVPGRCTYAISVSNTVYQSLLLASRLTLLQNLLLKKALKQKLMNSKAEFNRCSIPRLCMKMGEKEYSARGKEKKIEEEKEVEIVEKIRILRKNINKHRHERLPDKNQPKRKKRKLETSAEYMREITEEEEYIEEQMEKNIEKRQKEIDRRKRENSKRKCQQTDIRTFYVGGEKEMKKQRTEEPEYKRVTLEEMRRIIEENLEILSQCLSVAEPSLNLVGDEMTRSRLSLAEHTKVLEIITEDDEKIDLSVAGPSPNLGGSEMSRLPEYTNITKICETVREGEQEKDAECG